MRAAKNLLRSIWMMGNDHKIVDVGDKVIPIQIFYGKSNTVGYEQWPLEL